MKNPRSAIVLLLAFVSILYFRFNNKNWGINDYHGVITYDDFGYYLYLPATFIYNDLAIEDLEWVNKVRERYQTSPAFYQAHKRKDGKHAIQYTMGMSIMYAPAFFLSHLYALIDSEYPADGFSAPYQLGLLVYALMYLFLGLLILRSFLLKYFNDSIVMLLLLTLIVGTNYFQISQHNTTSPHVFLFTNYALILFLTDRWYKEKRRKDLFLLGFVFAITVLSRPNEIILIIPILLWGVFTKAELRNRWNEIKSQRADLLKVSSMVLAIGLLQSFYWFYTTGKFFFDSYPLEGFKLYDPYLKEFLLSYKKGWLIYTPVAILFFISYISLYRKKPELFYGLFLFGLLNIWILSSWDCWWYAGSFSQRSIVHSYPMYIFPLGFLYQEVVQRRKWLLASLLSIFLMACILLNLFQTWQQHIGMLHTVRMNKLYYWEILGQRFIEPSSKKLLEYPRGNNQLPKPPPDENSLIYFNSFKSENNPTIRIDSNGYELNDGHLELNASRTKSKKIGYSYEELGVTSDVYFVVNVRVKSERDISQNPFSIVIESKDVRSGKKYGWGTVNWEDIDFSKKKNKDGWYSIQASFVPPNFRSVRDSIWTHLQYWGDDKILFDDYSVEIFTDSYRSELDQNTMIQTFSTLNRGNWTKSSGLAPDRSIQRIKDDLPYSSTLEIDSIMNLGFKRVIFTSDFLNQSSDKGFMVMSIEDESERYDYFSIPIRKSKYWQTLDHEIVLKDYPASARIKFYLWNSSKEPIYINYLKANTVERDLSL